MLDRCSACGRPAAQVKTLLPARASGVDEAICERCITESADAIANAPTRIPGMHFTCAYCTKAEDNVAVMVAVGARKICEECVEAYSTQI